jgi:hypothetical protein
METSKYVKEQNSWIHGRIRNDGNQNHKLVQIFVVAGKIVKYVFSQIRLYFSPLMKKDQLNPYTPILVDIYSFSPESREVRQRTEHQMKLALGKYMTAS